MMPRLLLLGLAWAAHAQAEPHHSTARLTCGRASLTAETTASVPADDAPIRWLSQTLRLRVEGVEKEVRLAHEGLSGKPGEGALDAVVLSWACVTSERGANYIVLAYGCGTERVAARCGGEREWFRLLSDTGERLDRGFSRQDRRYARLEARLGLAERMSQGVALVSIVDAE